MTSPDSCRIKEIESVEALGLVHVFKLLRMGCYALLTPACGSVGGWEPL